MNDSRLIATIPTEIGLASNLQELNLSFNDVGLTGTIPTEVGFLSQLTYLNLGTFYLFFICFRTEGKNGKKLKKIYMSQLFLPVDLFVVCLSENDLPIRVLLLLFFSMLLPFEMDGG